MKVLTKISWTKFFLTVVSQLLETKHAEKIGQLPVSLTLSFCSRIGENAQNCTRPCSAAHVVPSSARFVPSLAAIPTKP